MYIDTLIVTLICHHDHDFMVAILNIFLFSDFFGLNSSQGHFRMINLSLIMLKYKKKDIHSGAYRLRCVN